MENNQSSSSTNSTPVVGLEVKSRYETKFEVGKTSRCPRVDTDKESEKPKKKVSGTSIWGNSDASKKR